MTKIHAVRKEYQEPFKDVVAGYAQMGYSRRFTAKVLGFNLSYFRDVLDRFDLHEKFKPQKEMVQECKGRGKGWPLGKRRQCKQRYSDEYLLSLVLKWPHYSDFKTVSPVDISTVVRRFKLPWAEITALAKRGTHG